MASEPHYFFFLQKTEKQEEQYDAECVVERAGDRTGVVVVPMVLINKVPDDQADACCNCNNDINDIFSHGKSFSWDHIPCDWGTDV